jgi:hypothetical protein
MLKPTNVEFREELKPKRITINELSDLLDTATSGNKIVKIEASWPQGQQTESDDPSLLQEIYNPHQLKSLRLFVCTTTTRI